MAGLVPAIHVAAEEKSRAGSRPASERGCWDRSCRTTWMAGLIPGSCPGTAMTIKSPYAAALRERPRGDRMWTGCAFLPRHGRAKSRPSTWWPQRKPCRIAPGLRASLLQSLLQDDVDGRADP